MPSISDRTDRHVVIDKRDGEYICFPDVICADDGRLIVAYNESDQHVTPSRRKLLLKQSFDNGATWGDVIRMDVRHSHCPRLTKLADGQLLIVDVSHTLYSSTDNGDSWQATPMKGLRHDMFDRIIDLGEDTFLTTGHKHRGTIPQPAIRQAPAEQMVYRSLNRGEDWTALTVMARERNLVLCEASMTRLPDGRLLALLRENSFVYEPMYCTVSRDEGETWSAPVPTPLIGHRPTMGLISDGRLLVTYRNVAPDGGTVAWIGTPEELASDFQVQGRHPISGNPTLTAEGLRIRNGEGTDDMVRYALRPMTDPRKARTVLEAEVRVDRAGANGCGLRLGTWWKITPDAIIPDLGEETATPVALEPGRFNTFRLEYGDGQVALSVNGTSYSTISVDEDLAAMRGILFGAPYPFEDNEVDATWKRVSLTISEPHTLREYAWSWHHQDGPPDLWAQDAILELRNARTIQPPDYGYSGWTEMADGSIFCVYHHADDDEKYDPLFTSHICGTRFTPDDFS